MLTLLKYFTRTSDDFFHNRIFFFLRDPCVEQSAKMRSKHGKRITIVKNHHPTHLCLLQGKPQKSFTIFGKFIENDFIIMRIIFRDSNWVDA